MISLQSDIKNANAIWSYTDRRFTVGRFLRFDGKICSLAEASLAKEWFREADGAVM